MAKNKTENKTENGVDRSGTFGLLWKISLPLILTHLNIAFMSFADRLFLGWYSPKALAAALPAAALSFTFASFFMGTAGYAGTFVAQYYGSDKKERIGPVLWQGFYFSLIILPLIPLLWWISPLLFGHFQQDTLILQYEIEYFNFLNLGYFPLALLGVLSGYWSGRGHPWPLVWVNVVGTLINLVLDYGLIFGKWGLPQWGVKGAAIATSLAQLLTVFILVVMLFRKKMVERYQLFLWKFNPLVFFRLIRFGMPAGVHFFVDVLAFSVFTLLLGTLGEVELAASNIAFQIHFLAFLPLMGIGFGVQILVGQYMGQKNPRLAQKALAYGARIVGGFMAFMALLYLGIPTLFADLFLTNASAETVEPIRNLTVDLLRFCALFSLFDGFQVLFSAHLKGAGDTSYVMKVLLLCGTLVLVLPSALVVYSGVKDIYWLWSILTLYMVVLMASFGWRIRKGHWKSIDMIGEAPLPNQGE